MCQGQLQDILLVSEEPLLVLLSNLKPSEHCPLGWVEAVALPWQMAALNSNVTAALAVVRRAKAERVNEEPQASQALELWSANPQRGF